MGVSQMYRIAQYELGPRRFWWWWCGGLKVYDAVAVALWFALNIVCVQQRVCLELPGLQGMCHRGSPVMMPLRLALRGCFTSHTVMTWGCIWSSGSVLSVVME